jgi:chaperone modulatory protein CbpM
MPSVPEPLSGKVLEDTQFSLDQLSEICGTRSDYIVELVEEGIIEPILRQDSSTWVFEGYCFKRVRTAMNLQQDLGVNLPGAALALDLMQEVENLRAGIEKFQTSRES